MKNILISISLPINVYTGLQIMAKKDMRSARNYIAKLIIEHVPENIIPKESIIESSKPTAKAILTQIRDDDTNCIQCGVHVVLSPASFASIGMLCKPCREKKFAN